MPTGTPSLTARQQEIWQFLAEYVDEHGYPPTVREIGDAVGLASPSTVHAHLANLERAGLLRRDPTKPRAIELVGRRRSERGPHGRRNAETPLLPLVGRIAAGGPLLAEEAVEDRIAVPEPLGRNADFLLRVQGDSMVEAGILDGDVVVVRRQDDARDGEVVGEGATDAPGGAHAEAAALARAGDQARGATVYVTLEPCSHHGRTPPCADALVDAGVSRVVVAIEDPGGQRDGQREEDPPSIGGIPRPFRNPSEKGDHRRIERVLQEQGPVEPAAPQFPGQPKAAEGSLMTTGALVDHHLVHVRMMAEHLRHERPGEQYDPGVRKGFANARQRGGRHYRVAQPVRRPDQQRSLRIAETHADSAFAGKYAGSSTGFAIIPPVLETVPSPFFAPSRRPDLV